jgi:integrase
MPTIRHEDPWAIGFRNSVRTSTAEGWSVREYRGGMRLQVRTPGKPMQTVVLPFDWAKRSVGDALVRVRNIYGLTEEGHSLRAAAEIADGKAPKPDLDWGQAAAAFKTQKLEHGNAIKQVTWEHGYEPVLQDALQQLTGRKPPSNPADLIDLCIRDWKPGSRARQIRAQSLSQFLRHCVLREGFPQSWLPPLDIRDHVGSKSIELAAGQKGDPLTDQQILTLLASFPSDPVGQRWLAAIQLLAELGLRPIELRFLSTRLDPLTGETFWWCAYRKRSGGGATEPRRVYPLPLSDAEGRQQDWELLSRWQQGEIELPNLASGNGAGDALATYLNRRSSWRALRRQMEEAGQRAVPYSFRHSYSLRGHRLGIDPGAMAHSMGHSLEVHLRSYPWASASNTAAAFARVGVAD